MRCGEFCIDRKLSGRLLPGISVGKHGNALGLRMRLVLQTLAILLGLSVAAAPMVRGQNLQFPQSPVVLRDIRTPAGTNAPVMVPLNPATQQGLYPSTGSGSPLFDPYATRPSYQNPGYQYTAPTANPGFGSPAVLPPNTYSAPGYGLPSTSGGMFGATPSTGAPNTYGPGFGMQGTGLPSTSIPTTNLPGGVLPGGSALPGTGYSTPMSPSYPGLGQSGSIGVFNGGAPTSYPTNPYLSTTPPSLFPSSIFGNNNGGGGLFGNMFGNNPYGYTQPGYGYPANPYINNGGILAPGAMGGASPYGWNQPGAAPWSNSPPFIRLFQGPRIRHAFIYGNNGTNALQINDTDASLAFAIPNFLFSNQPVYILPSFSFHQWDGPNAPSPADLPANAYSAFLDSGWQSDPLRLLGAELGVRVGVFSDFNTFTSDSLRVMGRGLARLRLTPTATIKGGVIYLDRNRVKLLPAGGLLWQPNPGTRFDLFFPEPKLAHYLSTVGNFDTWWYLGGYYGGGAWTIERANGTKDSIDINDIRLLLGLEWGRNDQIREGRRTGFLEIGYVFNRELLYKNTPAHNIDLDDSFVIRAGLGY